MVPESAAVTFFIYRRQRARDTVGAMRKLAVVALALLVVCAVPAFAAKHVKVQHPKSAHPTNPYLKHRPKHKPHPAGHKG